MAVRTLLTAEQLMEISADTRAELVKGELVEMAPPGGEHGKIVTNIVLLVGNYVRANKLGRVYTGETGVVLEHDPDTVRAPDCLFITASRLSLAAEPTGYLDVIPELMIEVVSPNDRWSEIEEKVAEYLSAGVRLIWIVNPKTRSVHVYRPASDVKRVLEDDTLDGEDILPGFSVFVKELFEYQA